MPVLIDPGMGLRGLGRCLTLAAPEAFIGSRKAVLARRIFHWARHSIRQTVSIDALMGQAASMPALRANSAKPEAPAAILFTSGSTGPAKGVVYTHEMLCDQVKQLAQVFHFSPGEIDLCTFPLFALFAPALGMTSVIPEMEPTRPARADPRKLVDAVVTNRVTNIFGSPALLRVLGRFGATERITLPTVRRVISAGAPVSAAVMEAMTAMLTPGVEIFTPYGATEALPVSIIGSRELLLETRHRTEWGAGFASAGPWPASTCALSPPMNWPCQACLRHWP